MKKIIAAIVAGMLVGVAGSYAILDRGAPGAATQQRQPVRDLVDVPKMSPAAAAEHRVDRYENLYSLAQVLALPSDYAQFEALYVLAGRSDSGAVQNLIYEANRIGNTIDRDSALHILFFRLTELDPDSALAMARSASFASDRGVEAEVWRSWGRHDLDSALLAASSQSTAGLRNAAAQALYSAFGYMGNETTDKIERELGIRPDRTSRARFIYEMADRSPADTIRYLEQMESSRAQEESVYWLAYHLSRTDADRAPGYANLFEDGNLREQYNSIVASSTATVDPRTVLDRMFTSYQSRPDRGEIYSAMRELLSQDIDSALQYFEQARSTQDRQMFSHMIGEELARQDPLRAIEWARDNERSVRFSQILAQVAMSNPQLAMEEARNIQHSDRRSDAFTAVAAVIAQRDAQLAAELVNQIANSRERNTAASRVFSQWAQIDPEAALHWIETNNNLDLNDVLQQASPRYLMSNIDAAMRVLPHLNERNAASWRVQIAKIVGSQHSASEAQSFINQYRDKDDYGKLVVSVIGGLVQHDPAAARRLAEQLPAGVDRDTAYAQLIGHHAKTNPVEAAVWVTSIKDERQRSYAMNKIASNWHSQDPQAATRWADNLPRGTQRDDAIVSLASKWQDPTPSQKLMLDSIGDPAKKTQAQVAQLYEVARRDWQQAQSILDGMTLSASERQRVQEYIDRYRNR